MGIISMNINNFSSFFLSYYNSLNSATNLSPDKTAVGYVGTKNVKIDGP